MAKLNGDFGFTGSLGNLSAYTRRDMKKVILRGKGGPSKEKIKTSPRFDATRRNNAEFGGRATASRWVMHMLWHLKSLADYNIAGPINALLKHIQTLDPEGELGERSIQLSKTPSLLEGFSLNQQRPFDTAIRTQISYTLLRNKQSVSINIPALLPAINFHPQVSYPMYSLVATLGFIPDLFYHPFGYRPSSEQYEDTGSMVVYSDWYPVLQGSPAHTLEMQYPMQPPDGSFCMIAGIGIRYGIMKETGVIEQAPYAGSAKVLAMA